MDLRANTAVDVLIGPFIDDTDGKTAETGLTLDVEVSKNGQALANKNDATTPTHDAAGTVDGYYNCELDATDTNTEGILVLVAHAAGFLPVRHSYNIMAEAAWDSLYVAKDDGFMDVNIKTVGRADTQETEANNLESACSNYSVTRGLVGTALPAAAADAAGGVPISDAGGLALDTQLANTHEITAARMGALTDWINGGRLDLLLDAIPTTAMRGTDNAALASVVGALADAAAAGDPTSADTLMQYIKQLINILIGTAGIGTFPAEAAPGNAVSLAEVLRAIHVDVTGINGDAMRGTDGANTTTPLTAAQVNAEVDTALADIHLDHLAVRANTAQAGAAGTITLDASASATNDLYNGQWIIITGGTGAGQARRISDYVGATKVASVDTNWATNPDNTSTFVIFGNYTEVMRGTDGANTTVPDAAGVAPTAAEVVNEFETQSQADPTGFHVNVKEVNGTAQTANDNAADINSILAKMPTNYVMGSSDQADHDGDFNTIVDNPWPIPSCPAVMERPESGSETFQIVLSFHNAPDAAPTIAAENSAGTARDANLSAATMVAGADILYKVTYTVDTAHALEGIKLTITYVEGGTTRRVILSSMVRDEALGPFVKNTAKNNFPFFMVDSTDDISGKTGLTVTAERSIDGAAFAACANAVSEIANGWYKLNLAAADLNGDTIALKFTAAGANATNLTIVTVPGT